MREVAKIYLGNMERDSSLSSLVREARDRSRVLEVSLKKSDRNKSRILTKSTSGVAIGIVKSRDLKIREGDVFQTTQGNLIVVHLEAETLMVLNLTEVTESDSTIELVRLGHLLGNQHYPIKIEQQKIYVRLTTDKRVIISQIEDLNISGLTISWERVSSLSDAVVHSHHHH